MIDVESAIGLINRHFVKIENEKVDLNSLGGRVLSEPIRAKRDQPPFDRVAMDGIAVRFGANPARRYKIEGIQRAGQPQAKLKGECHAIEVMTGAMLPAGTDTVIPYERLTIENDKATLKDGFELKGKQNIHFHGSDYRQGHTLLEAGARLSSASVSLIAGQGGKMPLSIGSRKLPW